jgi:hypothetical protein
VIGDLHTWFAISGLDVSRTSIAACIDRPTRSGESGDDARHRRANRRSAERESIECVSVRDSEALAQVAGLLDLVDDGDCQVTLGNACRLVAVHHEVFFT